MLPVCISMISSIVMKIFVYVSLSYLSNRFTKISSCTESGAALGALVLRTMFQIYVHAFIDNFAEDLWKVPFDFSVSNNT